MNNSSENLTRRRFSRGERGVSLLELLIAMVVLAFGLLTVATAQMHAMRGSSSGRHQTQAAAIAQSQLEILSRTSWNSIAPTGWTGGQLVTTTVQAPTDQIEQTYSVSWRITNVVLNQRRSIDVRVSWNEPNRPGRTYTLSTMRFNYEAIGV